LEESTYEFDGSEDLSRPWAWATYRYLQHEQTDTFDAYREAYDADATTAFTDYFDVATTVDAVENWLPNEQEPMSPIFVDWIHISDGVVEGEATYFSMAVAKDGDAITTSHDATTGYAGIVAGYEDSSNSSSWLVGDDGSLWTFVVTNGEAYWWFMDDIAVADRYEWTLSGTSVTINGVTYEETNGFTPRGGIALYESAVLFEDILF